MSRPILALACLLALPSGLAEAQPRTVNLSAAGDLVLNPHAMAALADEGEGAYTHLLAGYAAALREDEIAFVNVEQPLVNDLVPLDPGWPRQDTRRPRRSPILGATPPLADALAAAGVDVAQVANNHAYDQGRAGLQRTLEELARVGITGVGAGADSDAAYAPIVVERGGVRVAFVACTEFFNQSPRRREGTRAARVGNDDRRIREVLRAARADADVVVLAIHWSRDFTMAARPSERRRARAFVAAGADVVLGTGPHVLHEVERVESPRGQAVVAYSLGNVVSGMGRSYRVGHPARGWIHPANARPEARDGLVLRMSLAIEDGRVSVESLEGVALWTENNWVAHHQDEVPHRIHALRLADAAPDVRAERLPIVRAAIGGAVTLE